MTATTMLTARVQWKVLWAAGWRYNVFPVKISNNNCDSKNDAEKYQKQPRVNNTTHPVG